MPDPLVQPISLNHAAIHVAVAPGGEIVLRGSYTSAHDGSIVDAATTTWPKDAPGGASVDTGGLFEISEPYGLHLTSRDPVTHEVHAVATGEGDAACSAFGVAPPCLPLRVRLMATNRLMTAADFEGSLKGGITLEVTAPPAVYVPPSSAPYLQAAGGVFAAAVIGLVALRYRRRQAESPTGRLLALGRRVRDKLARADAVVAAPLAPAIETALKALRARRIDAASAEGKRIADVLQRVEIRLEESGKRARADQEQQAADELVREFESALEAADEATFAANG
jgi:hypothetical protein